MASFVAGSVLNAFSFAGAGYLFNKLNHRGYEAEMKQHNEAIEILAQAKEEW